MTCGQTPSEEMSHSGPSGVVARAPHARRSRRGRGTRPGSGLLPSNTLLRAMLLIADRPVAHRCALCFQCGCLARGASRSPGTSRRCHRGLCQVLQTVVLLVRPRERPVPATQRARPPGCGIRASSEASAGCRTPRCTASPRTWPSPGWRTGTGGTSRSSASRTTTPPQRCHDMTRSARPRA